MPNPTDAAVPTTAGASIPETLAALKRLEETTEAGARPRAPRDRMLDTSALRSHLGPDVHVRWVSARGDHGAQKIETREADGYVRVSEKDGKACGQQVKLGNGLVLMACSKRALDARNKRLKEINEARERRVKADWEASVEGAARYLRSQGVNIDAEHLANAR